MRSSIKSGARAVADVDAGVILASVEIAAPIERVFRALTTGADVTEWWGSPDTYRTTAWTGDVRPGGRWKAEGVGADGQAFSVEGEYLEVEPPRRLVHTWRAPWDGNSETRVSFKLDPIEGGTRVTLRHEGFAGRAESCRGHGEGWERVLGWLGKYVTPGGEGRYFMARLVPPRTTFPADATPEELDLMRAHAAHCKTLLQQGNGLLFGPVADPKGAWGLGVLRAPSEDAARALTDADPVVRAGRGFRYELLPIASLIH